MKQSQILTPPRPSTPTLTRPAAPKQHTTSKVHFDLHASPTTTSGPCMSESSLWTLPGSSCFAADPAPPTPTPTTHNRWTRLVQKAASSNRDRHRARLEGDGWAFVGGRYSDEMQDLSDESAESVDDEFDVVVLPRRSVGC